MMIFSPPAPALPATTTPAENGRLAERTAAVAFEAMMIAQMLEQAGLGGDSPDAALARHALADTIAADQPLGLGPLLSGSRA